MVNTLFIEFIGTGKDFDDIITKYCPNFTFPEWYNDEVKAHFTFNGIKGEIRINQGNNIFYLDLKVEKG